MFDVSGITRRQVSWGPQFEAAHNIMLHMCLLFFLKKPNQQQTIQVRKSHLDCASKYAECKQTQACDPVISALEILSQLDVGFPTRVRSCQIRPVASVSQSLPLA